MGDRLGSPQGAVSFFLIAGPGFFAIDQMATVFGFWFFSAFLRLHCGPMATVRRRCGRLSFDFARLYLHRITSVVMSELASCHKEFQNPVMKASRCKQLDATCFRKYRDACSAALLNRMKHYRTSHPSSSSSSSPCRSFPSAAAAARRWRRIYGHAYFAWIVAPPLLTKLTWLVLGPDPSVCSRRAEQFTAH